MSTIKLVLADDHKLIRDGIKTLLKKNETFEVIAEADNGKRLLEVIEHVVPDVILIDINMPEMNGLDALAEIKQINPNLKFIILTMHEEVDYIIKGLKNGASGYLLKNSEYEDLQSAIIKVAAGGQHFNNFISQKIISNISQPKVAIPRIPHELTAREIEVLREVADGLSTKLIAHKLSISARTVETHRINIMKKLEAHNTAELIKIAIESGII